MGSGDETRWRAWYLFSREHDVIKNGENFQNGNTFTLSFDAAHVIRVGGVCIGHAQCESLYVQTCS